jgi:hypothetical protein
VTVYSVGCLPYGLNSMGTDLSYMPAPASVSQKNLSQVWHNSYSKLVAQKTKKARFKIGDKVRVSAKSIRTRNIYNHRSSQS